MENAPKDMEMEQKKKSSKPRCRMKKLLNSVQELLEFYFSDANLNHDRFLRKEIESSTDRYIDLSTMLKFNKLKQLTSDTTILAKSIRNSASLELNADHQRVRRKTELCELENTDARTVYVEEFPLHIDHDWLKSVFATCGKVDYISLPKFKHNNQVKGFAFIEYSTPEEAQKACQMLNTIRFKNRKRLSTECRSSEEESAKKKNRKRRSNSECDSCQDDTNQQHMKRRRSISETSDSPSVKTSRRRRRSSLCSTEEVDEGSQILDKFVGNHPKCDIPLTTTKRRRRKSSCISSDGDNKPDKTKLKATVSVKKKGEPINLTTKLITTGQKRKSSGTRGNDVQQEKVMNDSTCNTDIKPLIVVSTDSKDSSCSSPVKTSGKVAPGTQEQITLLVDSIDKQSDSADKNSSDSVDSCKNLNISDTKEETGLIENLPSEEGKPRETNRKASQSSECGINESPEKKVKLQETNEYCVETVEKCMEGSEQMKEIRKIGKKKNRQHKKKGEKISVPVSIPPLHVIAKMEWLTLKKEYKRLQRIKMSELKRNLKVLKIEKVRRAELKERIKHTISAKNRKEEMGVTRESVEEERKPNVDEEKENIDDSKITSKVEKVEVSTGKNDNAKSKGLDVAPGTVVALKTTAEDLTRKDIKITLSTLGQVVYVDYVDGVFQGFVRFATADDVDKVMATSLSDKQSWEFELRKLSYEEESEYFRKAEADRLKKYNKDQRKKRKKGRGVDKITRDVEKASEHIIFT